MKIVLQSAALMAALIAPALLHAAPLTGHFSVTGTFLANDVGGDGTPTLSFSDIESGSAATSTGSFKNILVNKEASPSAGTISYTLGGTTTYPNLFVEFVNPNDPTLDLFVQILNLSASKGTAADMNGGYTYTYTGDTEYFVGSLSNGVFTANTAYDATPGNVTFTSQDERFGAVTFSGTATASPVPEPSSLALLGTGLLGTVATIRRRIKA